MIRSEVSLNSSSVAALLVATLFTAMEASQCQSQTTNSLVNIINSNYNRNSISLYLKSFYIHSWSINPLFSHVICDNAIINLMFDTSLDSAIFIADNYYYYYAYGHNSAIVLTKFVTYLLFPSKIGSGPLWSK